MRILFFSSLCLLLMSVLRFLPDAQSASISHYVAPNGSGSSCTTQSPCPLNTGLSKAGAGDEVVLRNGTYQLSARLDLTKAGIMLRAENRHGAIIKPNPTLNDHIMRILAN